MGITEHIQNGGKKRKQGDQRGTGHVTENTEIETILKEEIGTDDLKPVHKKPDEAEQGQVGTAD